ncbi:TfuA-like protein [Rhizobium herbae]|uniref:TfuA-like protein n=1 Tax=Rhizobium herbae TaxID=508661 RepID=A0ABS7HBT7_9HYPH|nr:TfuA-like protein [Rhizobium herbae]MBW9064731.1 TfuA-like protein [Rhizobium herbae]
MKILFVGPTLPDAGKRAGDIVVRGPAIQGDVFQAVEEGASVIGIVDGGFEYTAPVWHKEILYALSAGVTLLGAASMGALRAAECHLFGMIGVGKIFQDYKDGNRQDDSDVAQLHGPAELGWLSLSEPLVNVSATLEALVDRQVVSCSEADRLNAIARSIFFKDRTWRSVLERLDGIDEERRSSIVAALRHLAVNQKRADAIALLSVMSRLSDIRPTAKLEWQFQRTTLWNEMVKQHSVERRPGNLS